MGASKKANANERPVRVVKVAARQFRVVGELENGEDDKRLTAPAEYAVFKGGEKVASMVKAGDGWRVCQATEGSRFGLAISPVGLDAFMEVKAWAIRNFK